MTLMAGKDEEVASPVDRLDNTSEALGINVSTEKTKLMTSSTNGISFHIRINGEKLDEVNSFKYIWAQSSKIKVPMSRIARTTAAPGRLKTIWNDKHLSLTSTDQTSALLYTLAWLSQHCCTLSKPGHSGHSDEIAVGLAKTILQGTAKESEEEDDKRSVGRITSVDRVCHALREYENN